MAIVERRPRPRCGAYKHYSTDEIYVCWRVRGHSGGHVNRGATHRWSDAIDELAKVTPMNKYIGGTNEAEQDVVEVGRKRSQRRVQLMLDPMSKLRRRYDERGGFLRFGTGAKEMDRTALVNAILQMEDESKA